ncbi:hypothetical protein HYALB_00007369 [Hymenoscyphus albidus]|uniref:Up-regulated during septation protein 1 domain-containing protein n=1 Tax=Hymenoscyphus albidus TaxID=595503 RepID=A0A9N9Q5B9_9HELO|nr:hypothetical protein HYALB_00007369 [Hymenoscyphus albidus]
MAHIAAFMADADHSIPNSVGLNNYIAREISPAPSIHETTDALEGKEKEKEKEKSKHVWRMHQPSGSRKLHLFPSREKLSIGSAGRKSPETINEEPVGRNASEDREQSRSRSSSKEPKPKDQSLGRRRKVSVPVAELGLGPMTTVQEVPMDSPTIPGRPALQERSISAPGSNSWRQHVFGESMLSGISGPAPDENAELDFLDDLDETLSQLNFVKTKSSRNNSASPNRRPLSPKSLAPLLIPSTSNPRAGFLARKPTNGRGRSESTPPDVPPKSARMKNLFSPNSQGTLLTPLSGSSLTPGSASTTLTVSTLASSVGTTPTSSTETPPSPKQWISSSAGPSPAITRTRGQSESVLQSGTGQQLGHRRGESETSIMDRGRPKKRALAGSPVSRHKRIPAEEQTAFEKLPEGTRPSEAHSVLPVLEMEALRKQALGQASRFDVLSSKDVDALSRELRGLDERCEYLRKTHRSLRSGRRELHERICSFLRSPRVARFSHESILKQEEALSELDCSIDDWVSKLEQAENRRTRVRQKLLEHVAAALIMQPASGTAAPTAISTSAGENTPPRSPIKSQSPGRLAAEVPVSSPADTISSRRRTRMSVESIKIYADSDMFALLADVEEEITRIGQQTLIEEPLPITPVLKDAPAIAAGITLNATVFEGHLPSTRYHRQATM